MSMGGPGSGRRGVEREKVDVSGPPTLVGFHKWLRVERGQKANRLFPTVRSWGDDQRLLEVYSTYLNRLGAYK